MKRAASLLIVAAVGLVALALAGAARLPDELTEPWMTGSDVTINDVRSLSKKHKRDDEIARIRFAYIVPPHEKKGFEDAWRKMEDKVKGDKYADIFDLKQALASNAVYVAYGEFRSWDDFMKHSESDYVGDWMQWLRDHKVLAKWEPVEAVNVDEIYPPKGDKSKDKDFAHVIIKYFVPGSLHREFEDSWQSLQKGTAEEKHVRTFALRKSYLDNWSYITYGTWDDFKAWQDHFKSDHVGEFLKFTDKKDIVWHIEPLVKVGTQPE